jgi:hypothetical protein
MKGLDYFLELEASISQVREKICCQLGQKGNIPLSPNLENTFGRD